MKQRPTGKSPGFPVGQSATEAYTMIVIVQVADLSHENFK